MEWYCDLRNVQELVADGQTLCERRHDTPPRGLVILMKHRDVIVPFSHHN